LGIELGTLMTQKRLHQEPFFRMQTTIASLFKFFEKF